MEPQLTPGVYNFLDIHLFLFKHMQMFLCYKIYVNLNLSTVIMYFVTTSYREPVTFNSVLVIFQTAAVLLMRTAAVLLMRTAALLLMRTAAVLLLRTDAVLLMRRLVELT